MIAKDVKGVALHSVGEEDIQQNKLEYLHEDNLADSIALSTKQVSKIVCQFNKCSSNFVGQRSKDHNCHNPSQITCSGPERRHNVNRNHPHLR